EAEALPERGLLYGPDIPVDGIPGNDVPRAVRDPADVGMDRAVGRDAARPRAEDRAAAAGLSGRDQAELYTHRKARIEGTEPPLRPIPPSSTGRRVAVYSNRLQVLEISGKKTYTHRGGEPPMNINTRMEGSATIVDVSGEITLYQSPELRKTLLELIKVKRTPRVIVNMTKVPYIDSAGVASLIEGLKASRDAKTTFALFGLSRIAREVLELTHLMKV